MLTNYPTPLATWEPEPIVLRGPFRPTVRADGSWRYDRARGSRLMVALAVVVSAGVHATLLFGPLLLPRRVAPPKIVEPAPVIRLAMPELKELEEPETLASDEPPPPVDLAVPVPMQSDLPSLTAPNDFVQPLNFASLLDQPDLSAAKLTIIPEHYIRGAQIAEKIGKIFNLEDLDRHPEPVLQPAPAYPHALRREGLSAHVTVEFIVDTDGRVLEPVAIESTHSSFNDAAVLGVSRWKFRAGTKGGRKVNVRMRVPILFKVLDTEDLP